MAWPIDLLEVKERREVCVLEDWRAAAVQEAAANINTSLFGKLYASQHGNFE